MSEQNKPPLNNPGLAMPGPATEQLPVLAPVDPLAATFEHQVLPTEVLPAIPESPDAARRMRFAGEIGAVSLNFLRAPYDRAMLAINGIRRAKTENKVVKLEDGAEASQVTGDVYQENAQAALEGRGNRAHLRPATSREQQHQFAAWGIKEKKIRRGHIQYAENSIYGRPQTHPDGREIREYWVRDRMSDDPDAKILVSEAELRRQMELEQEREDEIKQQIISELRDARARGVEPTHEIKPGQKRSPRYDIVLGRDKKPIIETRTDMGTDQYTRRMQDARMPRKDKKVALAKGEKFAKLGDKNQKAGRKLSRAATGQDKLGQRNEIERDVQQRRADRGYDKLDELETAEGKRRRAMRARAAGRTTRRPRTP
jgi:hypothetical protein